MNRAVLLALAFCGGFLSGAAALADDQVPLPKDQIDKGDAPVPDKIAPNNQPKPTVTTPPTHCEMVAPSQGRTDLPKSETDKSCTN